MGFLNALTDNYIWHIQDGKDLIVIDPGESDGVLNYLNKHQLNLKAILLTHDHYDHVGGVAELLKYAHTDIPVHGTCAIATNNDHAFQFSNDIKVEIIETPGHTLTSICYLMNISGKKHVFSGDTLFAAGCGRVFTGDYAAMYNSLNQLKALDSSVLVYPGHEYTLNNLKFAKFIEPDNHLIDERIAQELDKLQRLKNTLPVTMAIEHKTNPFFRCEDINIVNSVSKILDKKISPGLECFIQLRELKNQF